MKALKSLFDTEIIWFISFLLLFLNFPYALEAANQFILNQVESGEPTTVSLRHVFHHGSTKYPNLFRRMDLTETKVRTQELESGAPLTFTLMGINGTGIEYVKENAVKEFRDMSKNKLKSAKLDWRDIPKYIPLIKHWKTLINLAKLTYNAYVKPEDQDWYDLGKKYGLNDTFGWDQDGIRGYVFASNDNKTLVISIKGTSMGFGAGPTVGNDKFNDNRLFSCCCAYVDRTWSSVCPCYLDNYRCNQDCLEKSVDEDELYFAITLNMVDRIMKEFPKSVIWITGHSLGGALSSLIGLTYNIPAVAFESPGDRLPARRLHLPHPPALPAEKMNIWHLGHTADPIFMGVCNGIRSSCYVGGYAMESKCHVGVTCSFDSVEKLGWRVDIRSHRIQEMRMKKNVLIVVFGNILKAFKIELFIIAQLFFTSVRGIFFHQNLIIYFILF
ncbi:autophagy associated lipase Atg15 [Rhizophagus irregularis DAOM 181602=DAOM 197198]|nr:autophagy associated lipase Atg15 [Rhizophagus irregularis DAOM 181602=DAOM 197198]